MHLWQIAEVLVEDGGKPRVYTIGLGQGSFTISTAGGKDMAVNEYDNLGLFKGLETLRADLPTSGPVPYATLGDMVRADVAAGQ